MRIGEFEVRREIGRGGMGVVLEGRGEDGSVVAIKVLLSATSPSARARFERERKLLGALGSAEGFVPLLDSGESSAGPYLVMPFLTGGTLRTKLERGKLTVAKSVGLVTTLARALGHAHGRGIVHRDLKPENVLFTAEGLPLVADLGLAKDLEAGSQSVPLTRAGQRCGTAAYLAPEQLRDSSRVDARADVFSLGLILFECLTGTAPFEGDDLMNVLAKVEACSIPPVGSVRSEVPQAVSAALERAVTRDRSERFADGGELARALEEASSGGFSKSESGAHKEKRSARSGRGRSSSKSSRSSSATGYIERAYRRRLDGNLEGAIRDLERALAADAAGKHAAQVRRKLEKLKKYWAS